ncbi:tRNA:m(4)X modification enzyme TRM13-like [Quillaja saponaria]|uniref:tRNA:m(4)X modification enzyme TRM13 n=1 Tax=Quillaja saponaria TaxID=32244 RepID=A0AAD7Q1H7_QUISA|nr:tRNA:m(4)X modification enzyme TRM13-like [Quillaja saponaria]
MNDTEMRCNFWLPRKNRFCSNTRFKDSQFCGNHTRRSDGQWIQCPIDPSHSVLQGNLDWHVKRCPLLKQVQSLSLQPFYQKGINAGSEGEAEVGHTLRLDDDSISPNVLVSDSLDNISSELKRNAVHSMSIPEFHNLIKKIESIHESLCKDIQDSYQMPEACNIWIKRGVERKIPFQEKHVMQQASILGNLEKFGVLKNSVEKSTSGCEEELHKDNNNDIPVVVEFGAGRGYLTQLLADCYGIKRVFLVERKAYKLKADRSLRQKESLIVERLRIDIEDLDLNVVLRGVHFLAIGKHLCGPATDLTLRCCFSDHIKDNTEQCNTSKNLGGLAIATCCHHLCQWKHYINITSSQAGWL